MTTKTDKDTAGKPIYFYNGKFAGRYMCVTPKCPMSISAYHHGLGQVKCYLCEKESDE